MDRNGDLFRGFLPLLRLRLRLLLLLQLLLLGKREEMPLNFAIERIELLADPVGFHPQSLPLGHQFIK